MLLSILANLIGIYSLISLPAIITQSLDISSYADQGKVEQIKSIYLPEAPYRLNNTSLGMKVSAESALVVDYKTGFVLLGKNPHQVRPLASITKLMTAMVFLEHNPGWNTEVIIQQSDYREGGRIRVFNGEKILVKDLFNASLVASSNNSTVALARSTGLTEEEFVEFMNAKASELGMEDSHFVEPTGLDINNVSTAADIIKLARAAFATKEIAETTAKEDYALSVLNTDRTYTLENTDKLLGGYLNVLSGKTGYLDEAGYCLVSNIAGNEGQEVLVVALGSATEADRFKDVKALAQWALDNYVWPQPNKID